MSQSFVVASRVSLASLVVAAGMWGCSGEDEGGGNPPPAYGNTAGTNGVQNGVGGAGSSVNNPGGAGTGSSVDNMMPNGIAGGGGSGSTVGGGGSGSTTMDSAPQVIPVSYVESGSWRGYAWTADDAKMLGTTRTPLDYSAQQAGMPFCITGTVAPDAAYRGVALLGFNINQEAFGAAAGAEAPINAVAPTGAGVAVNYTKADGQLLRIQLQNPAGQIWCADLTLAQGPAFVRYTPDPQNAAAPFFRTNCYQTTDSVPYAREPISAVVMTIPGDAVMPRPYNVCVSGFADGNSAADAPTNLNLGSGLLTGTISRALGRVPVVGADSKQYIINNNAWGDNSRDGSQVIRYRGNSFEVLQQSAGPGGNSSPASFPSIYIGSNGSRTGVNGATTSPGDGLPKQISQIQSVQTRFKHNGSNGDYNATYDVWFAPSAPTAEYPTALGAFLMVWTYKPSGRVAIGNRVATANVGGRMWGLFVGPRNSGDPLDNDLPVISYVNEGPAVLDYSFDLKDFIDDALGRNIQTNGHPFNNTLFLTDVFAGFEIWSGGAGLRVDEFTAVVQ